MNLHLPRKLQTTWILTRMGAACAFIMTTCGFGHHPAATWTSVGITLTDGGGCYCTSATGTAATLSISYSQDGKNWTQSSCQNQPLSPTLGGAPVKYIFSVPNPGNWFLQFNISYTCGTKTVTCHSRPNPYPLSGNYGNGQTIYVPEVCSGC